MGAPGGGGGGRHVRFSSDGVVTRSLLGYAEGVL